MRARRSLRSTGALLAGVSHAASSRTTNASLMERRVLRGKPIATQAAEAKKPHRRRVLVSHWLRIATLGVCLIGCGDDVAMGVADGALPDAGMAADADLPQAQSVALR